MSEWKKVKLDELYEVHNGLSKGRQFFGTGFPFLTFSNVFNNWFLPDQLESLVQTTDKEREACSIKAGDVFITRTSETMDELGMSSVALKDYPNATYNGFTKRLRPITNRVSPRYIGYYLRTPKFRGQFMAFSTMTTRASLANNDLLNMEVELPSMETQHRIATILSRYDSLIENYQKQIKLLEEAAQRLYKEWFIDLHFPGHENTNIIDGVPEGWEKKSITDVLEIKYGKDHKLLKEGTIPVYGTGGIMRYVEKSLFTGESVLIPRKGSLNNIMLVGGTFWTIDTMFYSIPKENNVAKIVYFYLKGVDMYSFNIGAAVPSMTVNILSGMKLLVPNEDVKNKFETIASKYFIRMHSLQSQLRLLTEARDRLLPKLMSGEIEI